MMRLMLSVAFAFTFSVAVAQDGPAGIAVVQAPEAGLGICNASDMESGLDCARMECIEQSGLTENECVVDLWCQPALWSADIFMQHTEGPHWHQVICGWQDREHLEAAVALRCDSDYLIECSAVRIWDPEGNEIAVEAEGAD